MSEELNGLNVHRTVSVKKSKLYPMGLTVFMSEKINMGNYENKDYSVSIEFKLDPTITREELAEELETFRVWLRQQLNIQKEDIVNE